MNIYTKFCAEMFNVLQFSTLEFFTIKFFYTIALYTRVLYAIFTLAHRVSELEDLSTSNEQRHRKHTPYVKFENWGPQSDYMFTQSDRVPDIDNHIVSAQASYC